MVLAVVTLVPVEGKPAVLAAAAVVVAEEELLATP
jgi:hypothetical protein